MIAITILLIGAMVFFIPLLLVISKTTPINPIENYYRASAESATSITPPKPEPIQKKSDVMVMDTEVSILEVISQIESELDEEVNPKIVEPKALPQPITYDRSVTKKCVCTPRYTCSACQFQSTYTKLQNEFEERMRSTVGSSYMVLGDDCELTYEYSMGSSEMLVYCVKCGWMESNNRCMHKRTIGTGFN